MAPTSRSTLTGSLAMLEDWPGSNKQRKYWMIRYLYMDLLTIVESCYCGTLCVVTEQTSFRNQAG